MESLSPFTAISPIDGRYRSNTVELSEYFSEYGLMKSRLYVEIEWLIYQVSIGITPIKTLSEEDIAQLNSLKNLSIQQLLEIKNFEKTTLHDVKAVEYYLKDKLLNSEYDHLKQLNNHIHFLLTSEDVNSPSYSLIIKHSIERVIRPELANTIKKLTFLAKNYAEDPLLAMTHGQPATPTTFGKEMSIYAKRLNDQLKNHLDKLKYYAKFGGATGNYNAHAFIYPDKNWPELCKVFVEDHLGLSYSSYTTQSEPHDFISLLCDTLSRINSIICDLSVDLWLYLSRGVIILRADKGQVGSSTMPHKTNPIKFENAEGNSELSIAILQFMSRKLLRSRLQRDLTDSTCLRNLGVAFAHTLLSLKSLLHGLDRIDINRDCLEAELDDNWSVLAEPIQLCLKKNGINDSFEKVKDLFMGKCVKKSDINNIIHELCHGDSDVENKLLNLTPHNYLGYSTTLAKNTSDYCSI